MGLDRLVAAMLPVLRGVRGKPCPQFVAELQLLGREIQVHGVAGGRRGEVYVIARVGLERLAAPPRSCKMPAPQKNNHTEDTEHREEEWLVMLRLSLIASTFVCVFA